MILFLIALANAISSDRKCRVLALRGGGSHGAYEVGVLKAFADGLDPEEISYDYVSGVSIGALNGSIFALHAQGEEKAAIEELEQMYLNYLPADFWDFWPHKFTDPFKKSSLVDNAKMRHILDEILGDRPFMRKFSFQAVNIQTG